MHNFEPSGKVYLDNDMYSNVVDADAINAGVNAASTLAQIAASRPKNQAKQNYRAAKKQTKQENKSACGKKPLIGKAKKEQWERCVAEFTKNKTSNPSSSASTTVDNSSKPSADQYAKTVDNSSSGKKIPTGLLITGAVLLVIGGGFLIYKKFFTHAPIAIPKP